MLRAEAYETIRIEKHHDGVAVITFNRPERLNAVNAAMRSELATLFRDIQTDPDIRAAVLTGAGRGFCSGGDFAPDSDWGVGSTMSGKSGNSALQESLWMVDDMLNCEKPLICALNGPAVGSGATIALLCDVVIAAKSARIGDGHVKMGLTGGGAAAILPLLIGVNNAKHLLITGDIISADEALAIGLVQRVVEDDECMSNALELARRVAKGAPFAVQSSKAAVNVFLKQAVAAVHPLSLWMEEAARAKADHREAQAAFREKREPRFTGN